MELPQLHHVHILERRRQALIGWLVANDPNGVWTDEQSAAEGMGPITLDEAEHTKWQMEREGTMQVDLSAIDTIQLIQHLRPDAGPSV